MEDASTHCGRKSKGEEREGEEREGEEREEEEKEEEEREREEREGEEREEELKRGEKKSKLKHVWQKVSYIPTSSGVFRRLEAGLQVLVHKLWNVQTVNLRGTCYTLQNLRETQKEQCNVEQRHCKICLLQSEEEMWCF